MVKLVGLSACRRAAVYFFALFLVILGGIPGAPPHLAFAQTAQDTWRPRVESRSSGSAGELLVNGVPVIRFRERQAGLSPVRLASLAAVRLSRAVEDGLTPTAVWVKTSNPDNPALIAGTQTIITAPVPEIRGGRRRARESRRRAARAAAADRLQKWASTLRRALALPGLVIRDNGIVVPLGEKRKLEISGPARGPITVIADSIAAGGGKLVGVSVDAIRGDITLSGLQAGREKLTLIREGAVATAYVAVRPYAAELEVPRTVTVTGEVATASVIARFVALAARQAVQALPGALVEIDTEKIRPQALARGKAATIPVPVRVTGPEMLPVERKIFVPVVNRVLPRVEASTLFYSNNPERLQAPSTLFIGRMPNSQSSARLLYHHQSAVEVPLLFTAELINDGDAPARVQIVGGDAGPERDTVWVGYRAASQFVRDYEADTGVVLEVPSRSRLPLSSLRLPAGLTISGLMQLRLLSGPPPLVRVAASDYKRSPVETVCVPAPIGKQVYTPSEPLPLSDHVYPNPAKRIEAEYTVGGGWTFLKFGRNPLASEVNPNTVLHGNYGVFYDFAVQINNPTDRASTARIVFEPSAGMAGGIFLIGEKRVEIPQTDKLREHTLETVTLAPGESKSVTIRTLPLSGSNYPATIIVRP